MYLTPAVVDNPEVKLHLAFKLRYLNQFLQVQSFKYDIAVKFDTSLDTTMSIFGNLENYYVFKVLPFGLSTACYLFDEATVESKKGSQISCVYCY